jgi:hypothetical protein
MKHLVIALISIMPLAAYAQTKTDYIATMDKFVKFYNNNETDSICGYLFEKETAENECFWRVAERHSPARDEYGKILSYQYMDKVKKDPNSIRAFKVIFEKKGVKVMSFHVRKNRRFGTFRFDTMDDEIERMLKKAK